MRFEPPLMRRVDPLSGLDVVVLDEAQACGPWIVEWASEAPDPDLTVDNGCGRMIGVTVKLQWNPASSTLLWPVAVRHGGDWTTRSLARRRTGVALTMDYVVLQPGDTLRVLTAASAASAGIEAAAVWH